MNKLIPATPASFADLEIVPLQRSIPQATPFESFVAAMYRQRLVIAAALVAALVLGALFTAFQTRQYTATASVQLDPTIPRVLGSEEDDPMSRRDTDRFLRTHMDLLLSRGLAENVAGKLGLERSPPALQAIGVEAETPQEARLMMLQALQEKLKARIGNNTRIAQISFTSADPALSARIANAFADTLIDSNLSGKRLTADRSKDYLQGQLASAKDRLESSERRMLAYARSADLTTTVVPNGAADRGGSLRSQQLGLMTDSLSQATARRIDAQQHWAQVQGTAPMSLPEVQGNSVIQGLVAQKAELQAALQEERQRRTDEYPTVREMSAKIRELDGQIARFADNIKNSVRGRYVAAAQQERQLAQTVAGLRGAAMSERERSVGYNTLSREVETNKAFYDGLLQRYKEVAAASGAASSNVSIVDRAWPPLTPDSPNLGINMALAGMGGLILALVVGAVRERMHSVVRTSDDLEQTFHLQALGVVPRLPAPSRAREALDDPRSAQMEAYQSIAVAIEQAHDGILPKTLLITSSTASEGKSTSAIGLARSLAGMGKKVILVDADLRRSHSAMAIGYSNRPGFSELLAGSAEPNEVIAADEEFGFDMVHAGLVRSRPVSILAAEHMKAVLDSLAAQHDIVIVDGPPIMGLADAVLLARAVDSVLVVVEANRTHSKELDIAISRLPEANVIGALITKFDPRAAGVRYGSYEYYTYRPNEAE